MCFHRESFDGTELERDKPQGAQGAENEDQSQDDAEKVERYSLDEHLRDVIGQTENEPFDQEGAEWKHAKRIR